MNWQKTDTIIKKINALYNSISAGQETITSIEKDLMLNYIRALYELFLEEDNNGPSRNPKMDSATRNKFNTPDFEIANESDNKPQQPREDPRPSRPASPRIIEIPESLRDTDPQKREPTPPPPPQERKVVPPPPRPKPKPRPVPPPSFGADTPKPSYRSESRSNFEVLFDFKTSGDLADRLSERPVHDLTKALSINDRLLYMNQLFGKNMSELDQSLQLLNRFESMDEAKGIIFTLAEQHNWLDEDRVDIAKDFVRLVRRRYL